jgi:hypothetical protein
VSTKIAGRFQIAVHRSPDEANWARVTVSKNEQRKLGIRRRRQGSATFSQQGFPSSVKEFLMASAHSRMCFGR